MTTAIVAIFVFGLLVFFHELGHFGVAKLVGIKVHEFAIGMGPKLVHFTKGETTYSIRALPIGGYVRMEGEDEASKDLRSFNNKPVTARLGVIFAGPFMNFVLAILLFTVLFYSIGTPSTTIGRIIDGSPAEAIGIRQNDKIAEINRTPIRNWNQLVEEINRSQGAPIEVVVLRDNEKIIKEVQPQIDPETRQIMIGIVPQMEKAIGPAISNSFHQTRMILSEMMHFLRRVVTRQATSAEVVGPVGIINLVGEATRSGWLDVVGLASLISINLGLMNLLPIPALDGSRIMFLVLELLRGKPVDPEKEGMIHLVGFGLLMLLMVLITYQDILTFFK